MDSVKTCSQCQAYQDGSCRASLLGMESGPFGHSLACLSFVDKNQSKQTVPNKGTSPFHKDYTKEEIADRFNLWIIGKDLTIE